MAFCLWLHPVSVHFSLHSMWPTQPVLPPYLHTSCSTHSRGSATWHMLPTISACAHMA